MITCARIDTSNVDTGCVGNDQFRPRGKGSGDADALTPADTCADPSRRRFEQPSEQPAGGAHAAPGFADEGQRLTPRHREVEAVDRLHRGHLRQDRVRVGAGIVHGEPSLLEALPLGEVLAFVLTVAAYCELQPLGLGLLFDPAEVREQRTD